MVKYRCFKADQVYLKGQAGRADKRQRIHQTMVRKLVDALMLIHS